MIKISKLIWDTEFWEIDFFNVEKTSDLSEYKLDFDKLNCNGSYILQALVLDSDVEYINFLERVGFEFVESKISLVKKVMNRTNCIEDTFAKVTLEEIEKNRYEFNDLYSKVSRFLSFGKKKVGDFYYKWIKESVEGNLDDDCIGYYDGGILAGFITYRLREKKLIIGLLGVFSKYQRMNISQKLLNFVEGLAYLNNCDEIYVSTQGKNIKAVNAYIKKGFFISNIQHWYYLKEINND